jgi:hypothetical protein
MASLTAWTTSPGLDWQKMDKKVAYFFIISVYNDVTLIKVKKLIHGVYANENIYNIFDVFKENT